MSSTSSNWRQFPLIRLLSSLKFGVTMLALVLTYACIMSALPQVRGALEVTEMQAFTHWLFATLVIILCLSVVVATLARIRFSVLNAGVLTVHTGLLLLCLGALWYFGGKVEGVIQLRSPRIELVSVSGQARTLTALLPEEGRKWSSFMPAFGGNVALEVVQAVHGDDGGLKSATVQVQMGGNAPVKIELADGGAMFKPVNDRLALRLQTFPPERTFFDHERPAIYVRAPGANGKGAWKSSEIIGLPIHRERYLDEGYTLNDSDGRPVPSKRTTPAVNIGGVNIPTGWFEPWRMPIRVPSSEFPFDVEITGYVPYIADLDSIAADGGTELNPAITLRLAIPNSPEAAQRSLFAFDPAGSILSSSTPIEFRWANTPAERESLLASLAGPDELSIEVKNPPITKRIPITAKQVINIEGTTYKLTVQQMMPNWPLMSPGFENAGSPAASIDVDSGEKKYNRTVIQRFPELTQDIDDKGTRHKDAPYDANLVLRYRTCSGGWLMFVGDPTLATQKQIELGFFDPSGRVERFTLPVGKTTRVTLPGTPLDVTVANFFEKSRHLDLPVIEPLERRRPNIGIRSASAIRIKMTGRDKYAGWSDEEWRLFSGYPGGEGRPIQVVMPDGQVYEVDYARLSHDLGAELTPGKLSVKFFPGKQSVESWHSDFYAKVDGTNKFLPAEVYTNQTFRVGNWWLFQSGASNDHWSFTELGVGNRLGINPMLIGCILITVGCLYAFYVKPVLKRRKQMQALAAASATAQKRRPVVTVPEVVKSGI